jgi:uncharacterized OB-fold protein
MDMDYAKPTNQTCDECGCKVYKDIRTDAKECRNGHAPQQDVCPDCGEDALEHPRLGKICGCD